jgi:hypothetical protein
MPDDKPPNDVCHGKPKKSVAERCEEGVLYKPNEDSFPKL